MQFVPPSIESVDPAANNKLKRGIRWLEEEEEQRLKEKKPDLKRWACASTRFGCSEGCGEGSEAKGWNSSTRDVESWDVTAR